MNSRTSLYGALQDSIVDAELLLNAMEPLEFAAHSHLIAATELKESRFIHFRSTSGLYFTSD